MKNSPAITSTSQLFLNLFDITNDLIILDDGAVSMILMVSAMNFGLLSEDEQDATIYAYAALLNSLSFPTQIVIRSQPKDVSIYLRYIAQKEQETTNQVYKSRIQDYRRFVESLVHEQNVLDKKFYFVIPLSAIEMGLTPSSVLPGAKTKPITSYDKNFIIEKAKTNLDPRRDHLIDQLARIGLYSRQLTTQELIQMLYSSYNPESFEGQKVTDTQNYTTPLVTAKLQTAPAPQPVDSAPTSTASPTQPNPNMVFPTPDNLPPLTQPTQQTMTQPTFANDQQQINQQVEQANVLAQDLGVTQAPLQPNQNQTNP